MPRAAALLWLTACGVVVVLHTPARWPAASPTSMFRAKTAYLTALPPFDMVRADQKVRAPPGVTMTAAIPETAQEKTRCQY